MRTSLEVVPHDAAGFDAAIALVTQRYPAIDTVNVPDRPNRQLTSLAAVARVGYGVAHRIPHLRACDFDARTALELIPRLAALHIDEVIVIAGDRSDYGDATTGLEPLAMIRLLSRHAPGIAVYAALDPHRYRDDAALARNVEHKRAAGAAGFFTQPLFDLRDLDRCAPHLHGVTTFWGSSPVVSERSQRYWERVNAVRFPPGFAPTLQWNHAFALRFLSDVAARGDNVYLMPIKVDIEAYLARTIGAFHAAADPADDAARPFFSSSQRARRRAS